MEAEFWHQRWQRKEIGFHEKQANRLLVAYWEGLALKPGDRIFLPLCGKTLDIAWLLARGYCVAGAELSELAVTELFAELNLLPTIQEFGVLKRYSAPGIEIYVGDIFDLSAAQLGPVDGVYDRAALVALPEQTRPRYARHLVEITASAPQFLITFDYDQSQMDGPPFCVSEKAVRACYEPDYQVTLLKSQTIEGRLKGKVDAMEMAWHLTQA